MANCNKHFTEFNDKIKLTEARKKDLKQSRKGLREKVEKWFSENKPDHEQPEFDGQGSMSTDTIINPIPRKVTIDGVEKNLLKYDVDDGIYFIGNKSEDERPSTSTYHSWVYEAVKGHTETDPIDKNTCIRTVFSDGHHIDQPIYYKQFTTPELAHKRDGYLFSDPAGFTDMFNENAKNNQQLRRLARYGKAWIDNRYFINSSKKMPSGFVLTILIMDNIVYRSNRDDIALKETLVNIKNQLSQSFTCYRPTAPTNENLLAGYTQRDYFMKQLDDFIEDATEALKEKNYKKSTEFWRTHLSNRFPLGEDKEESTSNSAGLGAIIPPTTKPYAK